MSRHPPRVDASRSRSPPSHGPTPYNPPLTMGSIESSEFFTRWRPVLVIVKFHDLSRLEEARNGGLLNQSRERSAPTLHRDEEQAIFTYTKILQTHQLNMPFSAMEAEVLFQVEQTWGFVVSPDDIKLTIHDHDQYRILLPADMTVRDALDRYRPHWHQEQDFGLDFRREFQARSDPYILHIECECNSPDVRYYEHRGDSP